MLVKGLVNVPPLGKNFDFAWTSVKPDGAETPVPDSATECGEPAALSTMLSDADSAPSALGVKTTLIVQLALAAREAGQLLDCAKSAELVPVSLMLVIDRAALPVFVRVTDLAALAVLMT